MWMLPLYISLRKYFKKIKHLGSERWRHPTLAQLKVNLAVYIKIKKNPFADYYRIAWS